MSEPTLVHDVPMPMVVRAILLVGGLVALILPPWELGRGVFPLNGLSLFFGVLILAAMALGWAFVSAALMTPGVILTATPGLLQVERRFLWNRTHMAHPVDTISTIEVQHSSSTDDGDSWSVAITLDTGTVLRSRPFGAEVLANVLCDEFRAVLGFGGGVATGQADAAG